MLRNLLVLSACLLYFQGSSADEAICTVNGKKALHRVSEKFLSVSIDPAVLLTGLNLSNVSLQLARHLGPAFVRIAGPSTRFVKYVDTDEKSSEEDAANIVVTPSTWFGINEWFSLANLTPVFGINDLETARGVWNPKSTLPLLEISDKLNVTCYWQLGYDCSNKTETRYKEDLLVFRHILDAFPDKKNSWKIIGSDLSKCAADPETAKRVLEDLQDTVAAVAWESSFENNVVPTKLLSSTSMKPNVPFWKTTSKCPHSVFFSSALSWARQIGDAARDGYEVIFRQPRLHEIFSDTPAYWVSVLYNKLMGRTVLDVKTTGHSPSLGVYAHCTKKQNSFVRSGAMTVLVVNNGTSNHTTLLKFGNFLLKSTEVQSYVLSSPSEDSTDIYLNGEKLGMDQIRGDKLDFAPKLRRAKIINYLSLSTPAKSVSFFVLPVAHLSVCSNEETELNLLMEEIYEDQNIPFSEEISVDLSPRTYSKKSPSLRELQVLMEEELESDENYNKKFSRNQKKQKVSASEEPRKYFIERAKLAEKQRKQFDDQKRIDLKSLRELREEPKREKVRELREEPVRELELELTSAEIRKILADRARVKAAKKNIIFTSEELEEIMNKATEKFLKNSHTSIKIIPKTKRSTTRGEKRPLLLKKFEKTPHRGQKPEKRTKRDINMDLLKLKTEILQNTKNKIPIRRKFENNEEKEATMRQPDQTSEELLQETNYEESEEKIAVPQEVFAELADESAAVNERSRTVVFPPPKFKPSLFNPTKTIIPKPFKPEIPTYLDHSPKIFPPIDHKPRDFFSTFDQFVHQGKIFPPNFAHRSDFGQKRHESIENIPEVSEEVEENGSYPCIHEYFGQHLDANGSQVEGRKEEFWEMGQIPVVDKKVKRLPLLKNRGFAMNHVSGGLKQLEDYLDDRSGEKLDSSMEEDYGDLESDEAEPLRLKRDVDEEMLFSDEIAGLKQGKFYHVARKPPNSPPISEHLKNNQVKMLKSRLAHRKKLDLINKSYKVTQEKLLENGRKARSIFTERYKSLTENLKSWKPSDILNFHKENRFRKSITSKSRSARGVDLDVDSSENEIDSSMVAKAPDSPVTEKEDYPHPDKVIEGPADTEPKLLLPGKSDGKTQGLQEVGGNVQKILDKRTDDVWGQILRQVTRLFHDVGEKLKSYFFSGA